MVGLDTIRDWLIKKGSEKIGKKGTSDPVEQAMRDALIAHFEDEFDKAIACGEDAVKAWDKYEENMKKLEDLEFSSFPDITEPRKTYEDYRDKTWPAIRDRFDDIRRGVPKEDNSPYYP